MGSRRQVLEDKTLNETYRQTYINGFASGKRSALLQAQLRIQETALSSRVNRDECDYKNMVVMLTGVDRILTTLMEEP